MSLCEMMSGTRNYMILDLPGDNEQKAMLTLLSAGEVISARANAARHIKQLEEKGAPPEHLATPFIFNAFVLFEALRRPERPEKRMAESPEDILKAFTIGQSAELIKRYNELEVSGGKTLEELSEEDFELIKKRLRTLPHSGLDGESRSILKRLIARTEV